MDLPEKGNMSSTHSANPLVCAAGIAVIEELQSKSLVYEAERRGRIFSRSLELLKSKHSERISHVFGKGMVFAILFKKIDDGLPDCEFASRVAQCCMQKGVLVVHTGRESIKLGPPLTITDDALLEGLSVIDEAISELSTQ
jgi:4-aminobutyrate aminotransferase-like enzyme